MNVSSVVYSIIGITVGVLVVATVLLPQIQDVTAEGEAAHEYAGLLGVVGLLAIVAIIMIAVRMMGTGRN